MATIATLAVKLMADPTGAVSGLAVFERALNKVGKSGFNPGTWAKLASTGLGKFQGAINSVVGPIKQLVGSIPFIGGALASIPTSAGGIVEWFKEGAKSINEMRVNSIKLGIPIERMAGFMLAGGSASEALTMSMFRLQEELGTAANKLEGTEVTFSRLGLKARDLASMPLDQAFGMIADKINSLNSAAAKGLAAFSIFGKRGAELLPILARGSAGLEEFRKRAEAIGLSISGVDAKQVQMATAALRQMDIWLQAAKQSVAVELSPVIIALAEEFNNVRVSAKSIGEWALQGAKIIAYGGAAAVEVWKGLRIVWDQLRINFVEMLRGFNDGMQRFVAMLAKLPSSLGGDMFKGLVDGFRENGAQLEQYLAGLQKDFADRMGFDRSAFAQVDEFFENLKRRIDEARKKMASDPSNENRAYFERLFNLFERGQKVTEENRTPIERFQRQINQLNELAEVGAISWDTYARAIGKAADEMGQAGKLKLAGAAQFGSQEAYSTVANRQLQEMRTDPLVRMEDLMKAQYALQQRQKQDLDIIADAARRGFFRAW